MKTGSLRRRVAVSTLGLLVLVLVGLGILVNALLANALRSDLRSRLEDRANYASLLQEQGVSGQTLADKLAGSGVFSTFTTTGGHFVGRPGSPLFGGPGGPAGPGPRPTVAPSISYSESAGQLTATVKFSTGTLTLTSSEGDLDRTLSELRRIELLAGTGTVLVAGALLFVVVNGAMRPLTRMTELARRIRDGARGGRLRPRSPGTDLGRTAAAFDEMLDALESAERQAQQAELRMRGFLADASHDLRTPLAGVIAGAEQVLRNPGSRAEREAQLVAVVRQARRAGRLVDDLLLMTRLDNADESALAYAQNLDLALVAENEVHAARLRHPGLRVVGEGGGEPLMVIGDPDRLPRLLANLLDNAAQSGASQVTITTARTSDVLRLRVTDNGPGIPEVDRERIFERFVRLDDSRSSAGAGLGLPISRAIAHAHGGELRCLALDDGACFELELPAHQILTRSAGSSQSPSLEVTSNAR